MLEQRRCRRRRARRARRRPCAALPRRAGRCFGSTTRSVDRLAAAQDCGAPLGEAEAAMLGARLGERAGGEELARPSSASARLLRSLPTPKVFSRSWPWRRTVSRRLADEDVGKVAGAEALARARHRREQLLRIDGGVVRLRRRRGRGRSGRSARSPRRNRRAAPGGGRARSRRGRSSPTAASPRSRRCSGADVLLGDLAAAEHHVVDAVERQRRRPAGRRGRRGRSPGSSSRCRPACRHGRRSARRAC